MGSWRGLGAGNSSFSLVQEQQLSSSSPGKPSIERHLLGQEPTGPLAAEPMDAGWDSVNGSTRNKVTEQLEELRHLVIQHTCKFPRQRCKACHCLPKSSGQGGWKVAVAMFWSSHKFFFCCIQRGPISPPCTSLPYSGDKSLGW